MKKQIITLILVLFANISTYGISFVVDGITYSTVSINSVGVSPRVSKYKGDVTIPSTVDYAGTTYSVTTIKSYAFNQCQELFSVSLPQSVNVIENQAFEDCVNLLSIIIPTSVTILSEGCFKNCNRLKSITIPSSLTTIQNEAFYGCSKLLTITIPKSVLTIGESVFTNCSATINVEIENPKYSDKNGILYNKDLSNLIACPISKTGDVQIPSTVFFIYNEAFNNCNKLTSIQIPASVQVIGNSFWCCSGLISVDNANSFYSSKEGILYNKSLSSLIQCPTSFSGTLIIPSSVNTINGGAFWNCSKIISIEFPSSITEIGQMAFYGCNELVSATIPSGVKSIAAGLFYNCSSITTIIIPSTITTIDYYAFFGCTKLTSLSIPASLTFINRLVFTNCSAKISVDTQNPNYSSINGVLYNKDFTTLIQCPISIEGILNIPSTVKTIGEYAFQYCNLLSSLIIPPSVTDIGDLAFYRCNNLTSIDIPSTVKTIGSQAFSGFSGLINVDDNNINYSSNEGVLYNDNFTNLISCPISKNKVFIIPNTVISIGSCSFFECKNITSLIIPNTVMNIETDAFIGCTNLDTIYSLSTSPAFAYNHCFDSINVNTCKLFVPFGSGTLYKSNYGWQEFNNIIEAFYKVGTTFSIDGLTFIVNGLNTVTISDKTTFSGLEVPSIVNYLSNNYKISKIGNGVFEYYKSFTETSIPDPINSIGDYAFNSCTTISKLELPSTLKTIGNYAFYNCNSISEIKVHSITPPSLGLSVFYMVDKSKCILYVPAGTLNTYKSKDQWKDFISIIEFVPTSLLSELRNSIKYYHDAITSTLNLNLGTNKPHRIIIFNSIGNRIFESDINSNQFQICTSSFDRGLFLVIVKDENNRTISREKFTHN